MNGKANSLGLTINKFKLKEIICVVQNYSTTYFKDLMRCGQESNLDALLLHNS